MGRLSHDHFVVLAPGGLPHECDELCDLLLVVAALDAGCAACSVSQSVSTIPCPPESASRRSRRSPAAAEQRQDLLLEKALGVSSGMRTVSTSNGSFAGEHQLSPFS